MRYDNNSLVLDAWHFQIEQAISFRIFICLVFLQSYKTLTWWPIGKLIVYWHLTTQQSYLAITFRMHVITIDTNATHLFACFRRELNKTVWQEKTERPNRETGVDIYRSVRAVQRCTDVYWEEKTERSRTTQSQERRVTAVQRCADVYCHRPPPCTTPWMNEWMFYAAERTSNNRLMQCHDLLINNTQFTHILVHAVYSL